MELSGYQALVWSLTGVLLAFFTGFAMIYAFIRRRRLAASVTFNQEEFITARRQVGALRIGWSFFAGALGAWVISSPPSYTASGYGYGAGAIGLVFYSLASGLPVIMIAFAGDLIRRKVPHVLSLTDFMGWRYGYAAKTYVVLLCVFNMSIATLAEYTTIGTLFGVYLGSKAVAITVLVGLLTMAYTAYGGLYISIITDQVQGIAVTLFFSVCVIFMAADFRAPLPKPFPQDCCVANESCFPDMTLSADDQAAIMASCNCLENMMGFCLSGKNKVGYSSIFVMPASLFTATIFSEAMWQRAWASTDKRSLVRGSIVGCVGIIVVVFFVGLCGILAAWGGRITDTTDYNLYFLAALGAVDENNNISGWIGVVVMLLAVAMNMSAIDSLQNGLAGAISSHLLKGKPVLWTRLAVLIISIPLIVLGTRPGGLDLKVLELFLIANMICCTSATPVLLGLSEKLHRYLGGASMLFSCINAIFMTSVYGVDYYFRNFEAVSYANFLTGKYQDKTIGNGLNFTWMGNGYLWQFFLVPIGVSTASMLLCAGLNMVIHRVSGQPAVPGFIAPATHPALFPVAVAAPSEDSEDGPGAKGTQGQFIGKRGSDSDEFTHPAAQPVVA